MHSIVANGLTLAVIGSIKEINGGQNFPSKPSDPLQYGTFRLNKGVILQPHIHKVRSRQFKTKTIEFLYVVTGAVKAWFFDNKKNKVETVVLREGEYVMLYDGGHGFKVLKDDTRCIEVKLGDFTTVEDDKEKFTTENNDCT